MIQGPERITLLKLQDVGHGGTSGQYSYLEDLAFEYAFLITSVDAPMQPFATPLSEISMENINDYGLLAGSFSLDDLRLSDRSLRSTKKRRGKDDDEKEYRTKSKKGDRSRNRLFQWLNNFGV